MLCRNTVTKTWFSRFSQVDEIIVAKQAGGGPKPRGPKAQDEDDDGMA